MNLALFEILKERTGITEQELIARIEQLEQKPQDTPSQADGQTPQAGATCELCGKTYSKRNNRCLYCGHINTRTSIL
jgi:ribosomal protein L37E